MKRIIPLLASLMLLYACATGGTTENREFGGMTNSGTLTANRMPAAEELLDEAVASILKTDGIPAENSQKAQTLLTQLIQTYPESRWRPPAEALKVMLDRQRACTDSKKADLDGCNGILTQKLKSEESENQCRQELSRILQENEQLKKDLQNLKNLEIELEQRNRTLR